MTVTAEMVKDLRKKSGVGIMECKSALKEAGGDMDAALDILRKKGAAKAAKKADRSTTEGAIGGAVKGNVAALVEVRCETDFVARNENFQKLCAALAEHVAATGLDEDDDAFLARQYTGDTSKTVNDLVTEKIQELGENLTIGRRVRLERSGAGGFGMYIHAGGGMAALVEVDAGTEEAAASPEFEGALKDLAMQVVASNPIAVGPDDVPEDVLAKEKEIFEAQAKESGKPDKIIPKIVEGRVRKFYTEACLLEQPFVKDTDKSVGQWLGETGKKLGAELAVRRFSRLQLGEAPAGMNE
ncbi:MAG: translation elongation factor Ts [Candidatus Nitrospinota bacterium M3_3B_026]